MVLAKLGLVAQANARQRFSCDAVGLAEEARRELATSRARSAQSLALVRDRLVRALASDPLPAAHKPGCGLAQVADYNPYLELAQIAASLRAQEVAAGPEEPPAGFALAAVLDLDLPVGAQP